MLGQGLPILTIICVIVKQSEICNIHLPDLEIATSKQCYVQEVLMVHNPDFLVMTTDHEPTHLPYLGCEIYRTNPHRNLLYTKLGATEMPLDL